MDTREAGIGGTSRPAGKPVIGYSAFEIAEGCYEYNENECYVADSPESLRAFLEGAMLLPADYRTDEVRLSDMLADYGASCGRFCMESGARKRFEAAAVSADVEYSVEELDEGVANVEVDVSARLASDGEPGGDDDAMTPEEMEAEEATEKIEELVAGFAGSPRCAEIAGRRPDEVASDLALVLRCMWDYTGALPDDARSGNLRELMTDLLPRKVGDDDAEWFRTLGAELLVFYRYMTEQGLARNGEDLVRTVECCAETMVQRAADPRCWGMAKGTMLAMKRDNVDLGDREAVDRWIAGFNRRLASSQRPASRSGPGFLPALADPLVPQPETSRAPEADPYAPCPCGSGKKYKWCCREKDRQGRRSYL